MDLIRSCNTSIIGIGLALAWSVAPAHAGDDVQGAAGHSGAVSTENRVDALEVEVRALRAAMEDRAVGSPASGSQCVRP